MILNRLVINLFAAGVLTEESIDFNAAYSVYRQRDSKEAKREELQQIMLGKLAVAIGHQRKQTHRHVGAAHGFYAEKEIFVASEALFARSQKAANVPLRSIPFSAP